MTSILDARLGDLHLNQTNPEPNQRRRQHQDLKPKPPDDTSRSTWSSLQKTSHTPKSKFVVHSKISLAHKLYKFAGKGDYLEWEKHMEDWFYYNDIPRNERLAFALTQLTGDAYKWWLQEVDDRWYYKEPNITLWRDLKKLLRNKYAPQALHHTAQANVTIQAVPEKKPVKIPAQKKKPTSVEAKAQSDLLEALTKYFKLEKKKTKSTSQPKKVPEQINVQEQSLKSSLESSREPKQCKSSTLSKSKEVTVQGLENSNSCMMHLSLPKSVEIGTYSNGGRWKQAEQEKENKEFERNDQSGPKEEQLRDGPKEKQLGEEAKERQFIAEDDVVIPTGPMTLSQAKCDLSFIQSDFVLEKLTLCEPEQPSSIISFLQVEEEESLETTQISFPLISDLEQNYIVPNPAPIPYLCDYPRKHCKEIDLVRTDPNYFVMLSAQDEKRFGLENVKEFCVSKSVFNKMIPSFETFAFKKFFKPKGLLLEKFLEFNSSFRVSLSSIVIEPFGTKTEHVMDKPFSKMRYLVEKELCEFKLFNELWKPIVKDQVFDFSISSIMHLFFPMIATKGTGYMKEQNYFGEERCSVQIKEKPPDICQQMIYHFGVRSWKYFRKNIMITKGWRS
ncbi:PREDICTED: uncharacterized protein LOC104760736 [Camelina sativa]|uniref:Uncharacterized protein LOC104760736 n=1 Tax=Camelina sativa TaxID=90675 RepID=A0ABM0X7U0_CAMSA|nr:PREDICTED: uncharacterized protein LOC104760736 [Camelina sativa]